MSLTHPKFAASHEENRRKVCAPCGKKISGTPRQITEKEHTDNLFFKFNTNENDPLIAKSEKELKEVMDLFNEIIEIKKN